VGRKSAFLVAEHQFEPQDGFEVFTVSVVQLVEVPNIILLPPDSVSQNLNQLAQSELSLMMSVAQTLLASNGRLNTELYRTWKKASLA
jgi:hypothetical protein